MLSKNLNGFKFLLILSILLLGVSDAWGSDTHYYAQLRTKVASNNTAGGKVYAGTSNSAPEASAYVTDSSSDKQDATNDGSGPAKTFYAFAKAEEGYSFTGWYTGDNGTGDYLGNASPLTVQVNASTTGDGTNTKTIYATFAENQAISVTFVPGTNGSYTVNGTKITASQSVTCEGTTSLVATASSGYKFFGWYTSDDGGTTRSYFSYSATASQTFLSATTVYADFIPTTTAVFIRNGNEAVRYKSLSDALSGFTSGVISVCQNGTVAAGNYTIPKNVTLLVPYDAAYTNLTKPTDVQTWASLSEFRRLSLAAGANITVNGSLCVAGRQWGTSSNNPGPGSVLGAYGVLDMSAGGHVSIEDKGVLHAYGFIIGKGDQSQSGTITIKNGGVVYEDIAINDLHGGGGTAACINGTKAKNDYELFVFNQYFVQNVEPKMTIEYGGSEIVYYDIQSSQGGDQGTANLIGKETSFLFQLSSGASITKWYDVTRDYQCYEVRGSLSMNGISIDAVVTTLTSTKFVLPLNNNMEITAKNGSTLNLPYSIKFQAGAGMIIEEGATVNVSKDLYFYDYQDWDKFGCGYAQTFGTTASGKKLSWHTLRDVSDPSKLGHAKLIVNGTLNINTGGALYTTSHGGSITSEGTGKIVFNAAGPTNNKNLYEIWSTYGKRADGAGLAQGETNAAEGQVYVGKYQYGKTWYIYGTPVECTPAQLLNSTTFKETYGDEFKYLATSGTAASTTINYRNGHWGWVEVWKDEDGTVLKAINTCTQQSGTAPSNPSHDCMTFTGWSTVTSTTNQEVIHTATYTTTTYAISYNAGANGSGTVEGGTKTCDVNFTLSSSKFTRTGYTQTGWSTSDGGAKVYDLGGAYTTDADITLYPFWTVIKYTITWRVDGLQNETTQVAYDAHPVYPHGTPTKGSTPQETFTFEGWSNGTTTFGKDETLPAVTGAATYTAQFKNHVRQYTVTWENINGSSSDETQVDYGRSPSYSVSPAYVGANGLLYKFTGWKAPDNTIYAPSDSLPTVVAALTYTAQYEQTSTLDVRGKQTIPTDVTVTTTTVHVSGSLNIEGSKTLTTTTLVLEASPTGSGQITGNIEADVAYLDYTLGSSQAIWYDIAVPWEVDATTGIYVDGVQKQLNKDFYLIYYNGALRASQNKHTDACWQFVNQEKPEPDKYMHPGRLYMIYIPNTGVNKLRFKRNGSGTIETPAIFVHEYNSTGTDVVNAGWNGIANPAIYKAYMNAGAATVDVGGTSAPVPNFAQKYVPEDNNYVVFNMADTLFRVSEPVFVQVAAERSVAVNAASFPAGAAPMRRAKVDNAYYEVQIAAGEDYTDRIFLLVVEGKEESYRIGLDLAKAGISAKVAQMWVSRYETKLCVNTTAPKGTSATYPLGIQVPVDGEYQIYSATEMQDNQQMYVTFNGRAIWNLAYGPYEVFLTQGTHTEYGLKLVQSPAVTTDIEAVIGEGLEVTGVRKVLIDNQIYIIREGAVYTINGQIVK